MNKIDEWKRVDENWPMRPLANETIKRQILTIQRKFCLNSWIEKSVMDSLICFLELREQVATCSMASISFFSFKSTVLETLDNSY